ncbi:protein lava lamp isoform X2 [Anopheles nili]|uniref:protein lava lamp isoform X2 n=1 Tax=Anopheles nili TaxID=185578 RepID=UPI00237BC12E|nr:protein lava lamp isoform X2 [Anopheles nili]
MANIEEHPAEASVSVESIEQNEPLSEIEVTKNEMVNLKETNVSLKRKKVSGKISSNDQAVVESSGAKVVATVQSTPSSEALGNLSKANGKRLKLDVRNHQEQLASTGLNADEPTTSLGLLHGEKVIVRNKPPIPPKPDVRTMQPQVPPAQGQHRATAQSKGKKHQVTEAQTAHTVQKLLAQNEQMRLELSELRSSLAAERNAVRVLRAQNESDLRKTKSECKKLQEALQHQKRHGGVQCPSTGAPGGVTSAKRPNRGSTEQDNPQTGWGTESRAQHQQHQQQCCLEVLKLNQEISALRETNRFLEEKYQISSEAERRKASDIRVQRDLHELRLTQLSKSARNEIQRLLEELKSKDRSIAQLKKELQTALAAPGAGTGGGCRKERKAAKNSAQQSHEMRKLREIEPCSGTISKSDSNNSIQSVNEDYEQLETKESLELTIVTATTTTTAVPAAERASSNDPQTKTTRNRDPHVELAIETTTCGNDAAHQSALPHELCKRTLETHENDSDSACGVVLESKPDLPYIARAVVNSATIDCQQVSLGSDSDSALSSMSPQPNSFTGDSPEDDPWSVQRAAKARGDEGTLARIKLELDEMQQRYDTLNRDYTLAKDQIDQLEEELVKATQASREQVKLNERIAYLVQREEGLLKESHELREQNELLEFRIIELEESHDKWSLRNNSSPTVGGVGTTKDGWTDTEKEHDELIMLSERSDSGVTSPNSHHHLEDQQSGVPSPCDLSLLDQIPTDDVRKRLIAMTKRSCYDEEDKLCLLQILSLLNNLEALSQDHEIAGDDIALEPPTTTVQKFAYGLPESTSPPKALLQSATMANTGITYKTGSGRIVATVQPFHSSDSQTVPPTPQPKAPSIASIAETFGGMKKSTRWNNAASLQESGVFVDEPCAHVATQTETENFAGPEKTNAELCAEIEKLNRFREKIEECKGVATGTRSSGKGSMVALNLPPATGDEACDRRRLQFYVERAELLENKLKVYESSGDQQLRLLAERLQREIQLDSWVKQLSDKLARVELENERLEEERCELEEIENDTRLRLQRLEEDLEVMGQRNAELEMSRSSYQTKYQDAKEHVGGLEELIHKYEEKIFLLEENENELRERIEIIYMFIPLLLLYNSWQLFEYYKQHLQQQHQQQQQQQQRSHAIQCIPTDHIEYFASDDLQGRLSELMSREKELTQNIAELNRAYNETLENADNLWAQMEREYKEKIGRCEQEEATLKSKIAQLEERLSKDSEYASERIAHLEEAESGLKSRVSRLSKENKELSARHGALLEEYGTLKEDYAQLQHYLRGPAAEALEREKKRVLGLEDELAHTEQMLRDGEESHRAEVGTLRGRLLASTKELNHIEVTNSELREEVETLEGRIRELMSLRGGDEERIKQLTEELEAKQSHIVTLQLSRKSSGVSSSSNRSSVGRSLAQELERPLKGSYSRHGYEVHALARKFPDSDGSGSEDRNKFPHTRPAAFETKEVKSLAETIILNAESRGVKTPKKSFVEEMN